MFDRFFSLFSHDIGIDLGTANTLIWVGGKGIAIREPSVVAMHKKTKKMIAIGTEAKKMVGKTPATIKTVRPLRGGIISDFDAATAMISHYIQKVHEVGNILSISLARPKVVIGIPSSVTEVERRDVWEAALTSGARQAFLIEEPMAAAIGEDISVFSPTGVMVVDIGGGTTEIAVISLGGIVVNRSLRLAGDDMDEAILHYIRLRHGLILGERTAENLKIEIGSAYEESAKRKTKSEKQERGEKMAVVRGRDIETGLPRSLRVTEVEVREALSPVISQIIEAIADILEDGVLLTGGGSMLPGLDHLIVERIKIPVIRSLDPLTSVIRGTGKVLEDESLLKRVRVTGGLQ